MKKISSHINLITLTIILFSANGYTQDTARIKWHIPFGYGYQTGLGDFSKRFGGHGKISIGTLGHFKTIEIGLGIHYLFGSKVKEDVLKNLRTPEGHLLGLDHTLAEVNLRLRGVIWHIILQKELSKPTSPHRLLIGIKPSWLSHWIRFDNPGNNFEPIQGIYKYGYDRLHTGFGLAEIIGYRYRSTTGLINFEIVWENTQAVTRLKRNIQLDKPTGYIFPKHTDLLSGLSFQWILPIFSKRDPNTLFY